MRLLIVEDERKIANYLKRGLTEQGYAVDLVYTGHEALDRVEAVGFDVIVLDILLPELNGLDVCRELRKRRVYTPVLMLTACDTINARVAGLDAGADDYLVKPFAMKELLARVRALVRRANDMPKSTKLAIADLVLDTATHQVKRSEKFIQLTTKEYAVLECLIRDPGRILTRTIIAEHVWRYDVFNQSNVVDVYIRNLRRKIDDGFTVKLIHTIRGTGYRLAIDDEAT